MQNRIVTRSALRIGLLAGLLASFALFLFQAHAQETPEATEETEVDTDTVVRIEIDVPVEPVPAGEQFEARVLVEDVEHLAGFDFTIQYNPKRVAPVKEDPSQNGTAEVTPTGDTDTVRVLDVGQFLETNSERQMICLPPQAGGDTVTVACVSTGEVLCNGGMAGASGSGLLGAVVFTSKGGGEAKLELAKSTLALDDVEPCSPDSPTQAIAHRREDASVSLVGGGGTSVVLIVAIVAGVALVVAGGVAGLVWYRGRTGTAA